MAPLAGALGPACRLRRRYAHAPAGALLTGLGAGEWSPLRSRPYAHFFFDFAQGSAPRARRASKHAAPTRTRKRLDWTKRFPTIASVAEGLWSYRSTAIKAVVTGVKAELWPQSVYPQPTAQQPVATSVSLAIQHVARHRRAHRRLDPRGARGPRSATGPTSRNGH